MVQILIEEKQIDLSSICIDGTKIEAYDNRYNFVWRGSMEKWQEKIRTKIIKHLDLNKDLSPTQVLDVVKIVFNQVSKECKEKKINFVYGQEMRKHLLQLNYEVFKEWKN